MYKNALNGHHSDVGKMKHYTVQLFLDGYYGKNQLVYEKVISRLLFCFAPVVIPLL